MNTELATYSVGLLFLGVLFVNYTRAFIIAYVCVLVLESLITYSFDLVVGGMRIFPQDAIICMMFLCYPFLTRKSLHHSHRLIRIFIIIAALLFLPAIWGYWGGASLRNVLRDCRPIVYLMSLLPFISIMRDEEDWQWFLTVFRKVVVVCAYLMLFGLLTGWRLQTGASEGWQTAYSASGEFSRGYGVISSYLYFPLALYLDIRRLIWGEWRTWPPLRKLSTVVLATALLATFVRANVLVFFVMMFVSTILIIKSKQYRTNLWKPWALFASCATIAFVVLPWLALVSPYTQGMVERAGSIIVPSLGGEEGQGTVTARLRVTSFTLESFEGNKDMILGHGYGTQDLEEWQLSALNHNSYFWLIYHGGFLTLVLVLMGFLYLAHWTYTNRHYSLSSSIDAIAMIVATFSLGISTGAFFNQNGPQGLVYITLFLAGCNATQYASKKHDRQNQRQFKTPQEQRLVS